jgi:hypothetical protein
VEQSSEGPSGGTESIRPGKIHRAQAIPLENQRASNLARRNLMISVSCNFCLIGVEN